MPLLRAWPVVVSYGGTHPPPKTRGRGVDLAADPMWAAPEHSFPASGVLQEQRQRRTREESSMMRSTKSGFTKSFPWRGRRAPTSCKRYLSVWPKRNSSERRHTNSWFLRVALGDSCRALPPFPKPCWLLDKQLRKEGSAGSCCHGVGRWCLTGTG